MTLSVKGLNASECRLPLPLKVCEAGLLLIELLANEIHLRRHVAPRVNTPAPERQDARAGTVSGPITCWMSSRAIRT